MIYAVPSEYAYGTVRISLGYENTAGDVEKIAAALKKILSKMPCKGHEKNIY